MPVTRHLSTIALALSLLVGTADLASAASHGAAAPAKPPQAPAAEKAAKPAGTKARQHAGAVKAVDPAGKTLTVTEKSGDATVTVTDKTTIKRGKDTVKLEDLKAGDRVTVVYTKQNGADVARSIVVKAQ